MIILWPTIFNVSTLWLTRMLVAASKLCLNLTAIKKGQLQLYRPCKVNNSMGRLVSVVGASIGRNVVEPIWPLWHASWLSIIFNNPSPTTLETCVNPYSLLAVLQWSVSQLGQVGINTIWNFSDSNLFPPYLLSQLLVVPFNLLIRLKRLVSPLTAISILTTKVLQFTNHVFYQGHSRYP